MLLALSGFVTAVPVEYSRHGAASEAMMAAAAEERERAGFDTMEERLYKIAGQLERLLSDVGHLNSTVNDIKTSFAKDVERAEDAIRVAHESHKDEDGRHFTAIRAELATTQAHITELREWKARIVGLAVGGAAVAGVVADLATHWLTQK